MSGSDDPVKKKSWVEYLGIHYIITLIFFFLILVNIISLTMTTINMDVPPEDTDAMTAKNLMISAQVITYVGLLIILVFLGVAYSYSSYKTNSYYEQMMGITGADNLSAAMRIVTFSILMFISLIVSALCLEAANYISMSDNSNNYNDQYNICKDLGKLFMLHFIIFTSIQGFSYIYGFYEDDGAIKISPEILSKSKQKSEKTPLHNTNANIYSSNWVDFLIY